MTSKQASTLRRLKAIETKTWIAKEADPSKLDAWLKAAAALRDFARTLPFGGR